VIRIAAVGDVHYDRNSRERLRRHFKAISERADLLLIAGDLTQSGALEDTKQSENKAQNELGQGGEKHLQTEHVLNTESRPLERGKAPGRTGARGTAAMDPKTRQEVARKGGLAVSRNKQHMAEIGRKGGQSVSKNREHMAQIGRKGGAASRGHR